MQGTKKKSTSVKDKLEGNQLDLSLMELIDVPVKEMAAVTRGTVVDLSNNKLISLPVTFPSLVHIVKLDLSKNLLEELPQNFGDLRNLKHLDLYSNKLQRVPVSFHELKELRWLDLKNNPLVPTLAEAAGECLDAKGCYEAARKVVKLMGMVHAELERKMLKEQAEEKAQQTAQMLMEEREQERIRMQKKAAKEKRRAEHIVVAANPKCEIKTIKNELRTDARRKVYTQHQHKQLPNKPDSSFCGRLFTLLVRMFVMTILVFATVVFFHWDGPYSVENLAAVTLRSVDSLCRYSQDALTWALPHVDRMKEQWAHLSRFLAENGKEVSAIVADKLVELAGIMRRQSVVFWNLAVDRGSEFLEYAGDRLRECWELVCREVPVYVHMAMDKIEQVARSAQQHVAN